jgi:hypothetical protein
MDHAASRVEVLAILRSTPHAAGLTHPSGVDWIPGFLRRVVLELGLSSLGELARGEPERMVRAVGVPVCRSPLPFFCGGSTARAMHLPWHRERTERRLVAFHELLHVVGGRLGFTVCEADWWLATAAVVHLAVREGGALRFPVWFVGEIPVEIVALFG